MLLNVLSVGYKLGKTTARVVSASGGDVVPVHINVQRVAMQLSRTGIPDFLEISCCTARISQIQMICIHFQTEVLSFSRRPILFVHFSQRSFVDVCRCPDNLWKCNSFKFHKHLQQHYFMLRIIQSSA